MKKVSKDLSEAIALLKKNRDKICTGVGTCYIPGSRNALNAWVIPDQIAMGEIDRFISKFDKEHKHKEFPPTTMIA